jgi:hypothetical protein
MTNREWTVADTTCAMARERRSGIRRLIDSDLQGVRDALLAGDTRAALQLLERAIDYNQQSAHCEVDHVSRG